jgi:phosphatidylglycerophosphatase A
MRLEPLRLFIATMAGVGRIPFASGTWGTLATIPIWYLIARPGSTPIYLGASAAIILISIWACNVCERVYGRKDPGEAVADEMSGYLVTMAFVPVSLPWAIAGFFAFRLTDIVKPWPARRFESLPGGLGIVADDLMAGVWANLMLQAARFVLARLAG